MKKMIWNVVSHARIGQEVVFVISWDVTETARIGVVIMNMLNLIIRRYRTDKERRPSQRNNLQRKRRDKFRRLWRILR